MMMESKLIVGNFGGYVGENSLARKVLPDNIEPLLPTERSFAPDIMPRQFVLPPRQYAQGVESLLPPGVEPIRKEAKHGK
jgi:hypothetical protein